MKLPTRSLNSYFNKQYSIIEHMAKNRKTFYGMVALFLTGLSLFVWNNYQIQVQERPDKLIKLPPQISGKCGIESCHGLDITCGPNIPEECSMMYATGDNCRQFASCQIIDGQCRLVKTPKFDSCKSCIEKCEQDFQDEQIGFFECESGCAE